MLILLFILSFFDQPRYQTKFISENKQFHFKLVDSNYNSITPYEKWTLFDTVKNKKLYSIKSHISDKTAIVSNDGKSIGIINDWPSSSDLITEIKNTNAIKFYFNGKLTQSYKISDLLKEKPKLIRSSSHFSWCVNFMIIEDQFFLQSLSLINTIFDKKGMLLSKMIDPVLFGNTSYLGGNIISENNKLIKMYVSSVFYGKENVGDTITFTFPFYEVKEIKRNGKVIESSDVGGIAPNKYVEIIIKNGMYHKNTLLSY